MKIVIHTEKVEEEKKWLIAVYIPDVILLKKFLVTEENLGDAVEDMKKQYGTVELSYVIRR